MQPQRSMCPEGQLIFFHLDQWIFYSIFVSEFMQIFPKTSSQTAYPG